MIASMRSNTPGGGACCPIIAPQRWRCAAESDLLPTCLQVPQARADAGFLLRASAHVITAFLPVKKSFHLLARHTVRRHIEHLVLEELVLCARPFRPVAGRSQRETSISIRLQSGPRNRNFLHKLWGFLLCSRGRRAPDGSVKSSVAQTAWTRPRCAASKVLLSLLLDLFGTAPTKGPVRASDCLHFADP